MQEWGFVLVDLCCVYLQWRPGIEQAFQDQDLF